MKWIFGLALSLSAIFMSAVPASAAAPDVTGKWHFVLDTPGGDRESDAEFLVDSGKVTGKYGKADVAGTFKDGKMDLAFTIETEEAGNGTLKLVGQEDLRPACQGSGDRGPLHLAAREFRRPMVEPMPEPHPLQERPGLGPDRLPL